MKYGSLSDELMAEIRESAPPTSFRLLLRLLRQFAIALFATFLVVVIVFTPKWDDPYLYRLADGNFYFVFISSPAFFFETRKEKSTSSHRCMFL